MKNYKTRDLQSRECLPFDPIGARHPGMMLGAAPPESGPLCVKYVP